MPRGLLKGQTLLRSLMNEALADFTLRGEVLDIGGGHKPDYFNYFRTTGAIHKTIIDGSKDPIDFEKDRLPYASACMDTVILCNVLEHIYDHQHLIAETYRVLKIDGQLIGFVPFWMRVHPDPQDYFRYTEDALRKMLAVPGRAVEIRPIGSSPVMANYNNIMLFFPMPIRISLYFWYKMLDKMALALRPDSKAYCPLGFIFYVH
jgi:SAM-dependent methyltransferase